MTVALDEYDEIDTGGDARASRTRPKKRGVLMLVIGGIFVLALAAFTFWLSWGYINPGWGFKVFVSDKLPPDFKTSLKIIEETTYSDNTGLVRWRTPVTMTYAGDPSDGDIETVKLMVEAFNTIPGFPGINLVSDYNNASITFATKENHEELKRQLNTTDDSVCAVQSTTYHHTGETFISAADILIAPGGMQGYRNSVILHECFHMVGFTGHTSHASSIINTLGPVPGLSAADKLAFMMIYCQDLTYETTLEDFKAYFGKTTVEEFTGA